MADAASLLDLPDVVLVKVLSYIPLTELLQKVNRTCSRLYSVIENNSVLWKDISPDFCVGLKLHDLKRLMRHSHGFETYLLPYANYECFIYELDFLFTTGLSNAKHLYWLDISFSQISTLCFLRYLPSLCILNVSECPNLINADFIVLSLCQKLDQLYLAYTRILPETIALTCSQLDLIVLDISGIPVSVDICERIISQCMISLQVTLIPGEEHNLKTLRRNHLDCSIRTV
jgi:hypothetical protein